MRSMLASFLHARRGAVAVTYALAALPLLTAVGLAIDYRNIVVARVELQEALDSAILTAARSYSLASPAITESQREANARSAGEAIFEENLRGARALAEGQDIAFTFDPDTTIVTAQVNARALVLFAKLLGLDKVNVSAQAAAQGADQRRVEVVLALDNTGSMRNNNRMTLMRAAAQSFVDFLFDNGLQDRIYVGVIPWTHSVNISQVIPQAGFDNTPYNEQVFQNDGHPISSWPRPTEAQISSYVILPERYRRYTLRGGLDVDDPYVPPNNPPALNPGDESLSSKTNRQLFNESFNGHGWRGCIRAFTGERFVNAGGVPTPLSDTPPNSLRLQPFVLERGVNGQPNDVDDPQDGCPSPMLGLSANRRQVKEALERMRADGNTYQDIALSWSLRMLSPETTWVNFFGHTGLNRPGPFDPDQVRKVLVLLTDGQNVVGGSNSSSIEQYYGCAWRATSTPPDDASRRNGAGNCWLTPGFINGNTAQLTNTTLDALTADACVAIRNRDVELYTIAVDLNGGNAPPAQGPTESRQNYLNRLSTEQRALVLLDECAGGPASPRHSNITGPEIESVLLNIAEQTLRLISVPVSDDD